MLPMLPFKKKNVASVWCLLSSGRRPSAPWTRTRQTAALCTSTTPWWPHFPPASAGTTAHPLLTLCPAWSAHASLEGTAAASWSVCATRRVNCRSLCDSRDFAFFLCKDKSLVGEKQMTQGESCGSAMFMRFNWGWCCKKGVGIYKYVVYKYQAPSSRSDIWTCLEFKLRDLQRLHLARDSVLCPAPPDGVRALRCVCLGLCHRQGLPHLHPTLLGLTQGREEARDRGAADRRARQ